MDGPFFPREVHRIRWVVSVIKCFSCKNKAKLQDNNSTFLSRADPLFQFYHMKYYKQNRTADQSADKRPESVKDFTTYKHSSLQRESEPAATDSSFREFGQNKSQNRRILQKTLMQAVIIFLWSVSQSIKSNGSSMNRIESTAGHWFWFINNSGQYDKTSLYINEIAIISFNLKTETALFYGCHGSHR